MPGVPIDVIKIMPYLQMTAAEGAQLSVKQDLSGHRCPAWFIVSGKAAVQTKNRSMRSIQAADRRSLTGALCFAILLDHLCLDSVLMHELCFRSDCQALSVKQAEEFFTLSGRHNG